MENSDRPIQAYPGTHSDQGWSFNVSSDEVEIDQFQDEIKEILTLSNGVNDKTSIVNKLCEIGIEKDLSNSLIDDLESLKILVDSRSQYVKFHEASNNPSVFYRDLSPDDIADITNKDVFLPKEGTRYSPEPNTSSPLDKLIDLRESCRSFEDSSVPSGVIFNSLSAAYSQERRPIPSAGSLYPLRFYLVVKNGSSELPRGVYQYDHKENQLIAYSQNFNEERMKYALNSETFLFNSSAILTIAADLSRQPSKYANRGYRYSLIEAGHAAQNFHLSLINSDISSIEYGGFNDTALTSELELGDNQVPLVVIGIGKKSENKIITSLETSDKLMKLVGDGQPINWVSLDFTSTASKNLGFYFAAAKIKKPNEAYGSEEHLYTGGSGQSIHLALVKAIAEGFERYKGGEVYEDIKNRSATSLGNRWLDPRIIRPLTDEQLENNRHLGKFDENQRIDWVESERYPNREKWYVPVDLVFYPLNKDILGRKPIAEADSSGMAAHTDKNIAIRKAVLELIERDAIMRSWLARDAPKRLSEEHIPLSTRERIYNLKQQGKDVDILDMSSDGVVIINAVIRSRDKSYPYFSNGAAASDVSLEEALIKAMDEAEIGLAGMMHDKVEKIIDIKNVRSPSDHGRIYAYDTYASSLEWLWSGPVSTSVPKVEEGIDVIARYRPYIIQYTKDDEVLQVVRAICPQLVPINFGYGNEYYSHPEVRNGSPQDTPHYFA